MALMRSRMSLGLLAAILRMRAAAIEAEYRSQIHKGRFEELRQEISIGLAEAEAGEVIDAEIVFQNLQAKLQQRRAEAN